MSDATIVQIVAGIVTVCTSLITWLTLWLRLKYGVERLSGEASNRAALAVSTAKSVESKLDANTAITTEAKDAANKAAEHSIDCDSERRQILNVVKDHDRKILAMEVRMSTIESQITAAKSSVDSVARDLVSTRHEIRGNLQTVMNKLDIMTAAQLSQAQAKQQQPQSGEGI